MGCYADPVQSGTAPAVRLVSEGNPLVGAAFYVNPNSAAMRAAQRADPPSPELTAIANTPTAYWMDQLSTPAVDAKYIAAAQAAGATPLLPPEEKPYGERVASVKDTIGITWYLARPI